MLLLLATVVALVWANSPWAAGYHHLWQVQIASITIHQFINDGLMAIFFLAIGLEIKREFLTGELSTRKTAALPIAAALGGMIVPSAIYFVLNTGGPGVSGWGIPMATDIAFAIGVITLLGSRVPPALKVFLTALAIVDDLGAVLVIALFYTSKIAWMHLIGFILALIIPANAGHKIEKSLHSFVNWVIIPLFALANAGLTLSFNMVPALSDSIVLGIILGLVIGKPLGITLFAWLAVKLRMAELPRASSWGKLHGVAWLGGIGFTMSLFIAGLAFGGSEMLGMATLGVLVASVLAGIVGCVLLWRNGQT